MLHTFNALNIEVTETDADITVRWSGRSNEREPSHFITPVLNTTLTRAQEAGKRVVMDFRTVEYMNSSTFTPLLRMLSQAYKGTVSIQLLYSPELHWQVLSFSAMRVFQTGDRRIDLVGA